jgi:Secretion system C-terminal sorting domain/FG-GAP-like repeat/HYDIN/CFA65/VesB-like, Ig-like domain
MIKKISNFIIISLFLFTPFQVLKAQLFSSEIYLESLEASEATWGDYDNDNDLDIMLKGYHADDSIIVKIYQNTNSSFEDIYTKKLKKVLYINLAWGDFDTDGDIDLLYSGDYKSKILQNTGTELVEIYEGSLPEIYETSGSWGDYDNDGDLDILLTGQTGYVDYDRISKVYQNTGTGFTEVYEGSIDSVSYGATAWGDYDNDGDLDILLTGKNSDDDPISKIYQNTGTGFTEVYPGSIYPIYESTVAWVDYDNDGDLDIFISGNTGFSLVTYLYRNISSGFSVESISGLTGVRNGSVTWGDYDNDGDRDFILLGEDASGDSFTGTYRNGGAYFINANLTELPDFRDGSVMFGDYDRDDDLDILITGTDNSYNRYTNVYKNNSTSPNNAATAPQNLSFDINGPNVTLTWDKTTDTETPQDGLSYNILVYKEEVAKAESRVLAAKIEKIQYSVSGYTLKNLSEGQYFCKVQAYDTGLKGGEFTDEKTFSIGDIPEINIQGNSINISDENSTTSLLDHTDFGETKVLETFERTFTVENTGNADLTFGTATITGTGFSVTQPVLSAIAPKESTSFTIVFAPESIDLINGEVSIPNNDDTENPYNFAVSGSGLKGDPYIAWSDPTDITYGTVLSETQLNALTEITGSFVYTPDIGAILEVGADQSLEAEFTPTDEINYNKASKTVYITVTETTGIQEKIEESLNIYPNPNNGKFYVHYEIKGNELIKLQLIDLSGKIILNEQLTASDLNNYQIQIPNADKGTYILRLTMNEKEVKQKIVIQ